MASVSGLTIKRQTGSSTYYATWSFDDTISQIVTTSNGIGEGDWVTIKEGASYYNGVGIPDWVMQDTWKVFQLSGDRAVLGENEDGSHDIQSPINVNDLNGGSEEETVETITNTLDKYDVQWYYDTGDNLWFEGSSASPTSTQSTYSAPSNALRIKVKVTPVSKTHTVNDNETSYWTGESREAEFSLAGDPPETPKTPSTDIDVLKLTASLENISDPRTDQIEFEVYNDMVKVNSTVVDVKLCMASMSTNVIAGGKYRVRCRAINLYYSSKIYGKYSDFTNELLTIPAPVTNVSVSADSKTSVSLSWDKSSTTTGYKVEYAINRDYFDTSSQTSNLSVSTNRAHIVGLDSGKEWFFRVCATNSKGDSSWSDIISITIGSKPAAPTTWSSTSTAIVGEVLNLYWVHNSKDNSSQTVAEVEIDVNGSINTYTQRNSTDEEEKDKTSSFSVNTSQYSEGVVLKWRVRTAGATKEYGPWSVQRQVNIYAQPTLELSIVDAGGNSITTVSSFPFYIKGVTGPKTQSPIGYHLSIMAQESYETVDAVGETKLVNSGDEVYSQYFDIYTRLEAEISAYNIAIKNGMHYTVTCVASMDSGLSVQRSLSFNVAWDAIEYKPNISISIDKTSYIAYLRPFCLDKNNTETDKVTLSVYRREFDGAFTEIISNIENNRNTYITDPHPGLDYARYRIVATEKTTGAISYYDAPGYPIGCKFAVIQWDEKWRNLENASADAQEKTPWTGSLLLLKYNLDVSDSNAPDKSLVEYVGRKHPVSYYGTQIGSSSTWDMAIPKKDKDTLYAIRRLSTWMGDVYVREPSGSGYWASVTVKYDIKHKELTIPISLTITRVEGGK